MLISGNSVTYSGQGDYGNGGGIFLSTSFYDDGPPHGAGYGAAWTFRSDGELTCLETATPTVQNNTATRYGGGLYAGISPAWWDPWWHTGNYVPTKLTLTSATLGDNHAVGGIPVAGPPPTLLLNGQLALERVRADTATERDTPGFGTQPQLLLQNTTIGGNNNNPMTDVGLHIKDSVNPLLSPGSVNVTFRNLAQPFVEQP